MPPRRGSRDLFKSPPQPEAASTAPSASAPRPGACVRVQGLVGTAEHNGKFGIVQNVCQDRFCVALVEDGTRLRTREENMEQVCNGCRAAGKKLSACSRCKCAFFCGKECLKASWKEHKKACATKDPEVQVGPPEIKLPVEFTMLLLQIESWRGGDLSRALDAEDAFLRLSAQLGLIDDPDHPGAFGFALACGSLGSAHLYAGHDALRVPRGSFLFDEEVRLREQPDADAAAARRHFERAVVMCRYDLRNSLRANAWNPDTDVEGAQMARGNLARALCELKEYAEAIALIQERIRVAQETQTEVPQAIVDLLAFLRKRHGHVAGGANVREDVATKYFERSLKDARRSGDKYAQCRALSQLGKASAQEGAHRKALELFEEEFQLQGDLRDAQVCWCWWVSFPCR